MSTDEPPEAENNGRSAGGRFAAGNAFAKGNPQARRMAELRRVFLDASSPEILTAMSKKLAMLALEGDVQALKLYLSYTLGQPTQAIELTGADGEPLGLDWARAESAILSALKPFGDDARFAVALAIRGVVHAEDAEQAGD
jgi:hypothetical protein